MMIIIQPSPVKYQLKTTEITRKLKKENCENLTYVAIITCQKDKT